MCALQTITRIIKLSKKFIYSGVILSYAKSLRNTLRDKNEGLFDRLALIETAAKSVLTYTVSKFPYHTPHNFLHSQNVEEILNWLVPDEIKLKMNDYEIFVVLVAAWLHDWGMVASKNEDAEEVRNLHHIRTESNFETLYDKIHLSLPEARIAGRICRGHRKENLLSPQYDDSFLGSNILIRLRFLAALLRVADECDVTANRTPEVIYYTLGPEGASQEEFEKHLSIMGIGKPTPYKLLLNGVAKSPKGVKVIEGVKNRIQTQLNSVKTILASNGVLLDIVEAHIDTRGFINKPIEFGLDRKSIVKLLIGSALYSRRDVAIRELLSNAVDTCRFRKLLFANFEPCIEIEFDKEHISFEDNGVGMNFEDASEYFSKKGHSFYVSKDFKDALKGKKFDPISKFGIGVLSSFLLADEMIIESKKSNCAPCRFTIQDLAEGWIYEEGSRQKLGTEVTLFLNDEGKKFDVEESLRHYAKNVEIPIFIKNAETGERQEFLQTWGYSMPEVLELFSKDAREKISQTGPLLTLHTVIPGLEVTYHVFRNMFLQTTENSFFLKHGIYVGSFDLFPCARGNWIALINCTSDLVDLSVSRDGFVKNEKLREFFSILYDNFIDKVLSQVQKSGSNLNSLEGCEKFSALMSEFFIDSFGEEQGSLKSLWHLKLYTRKIYPVLLKNGLTFLSGDQIITRGFSKITHYRILSLFCKEHIDAIGDLILPKMDDNEAIVFDLGPHLAFMHMDPRKFFCAFCEILGTKGTSAIVCSGLADFLQTLELSQESTPIDHLLPEGSFFTHMPKMFRGLTAQLKPFEFAPSPESVSPSESIRDNLYLNLVSRELFRHDPEIAKFYDLSMDPQERKSELLSAGYFAYDIDDPFLSFIISKAKQILSNDPIKQLIKRFLKSLAICCIPRETYIAYTYQENIVTLLEKTIAEILDYREKLLPLRHRMGKLAIIYCKSHGRSLDAAIRL